MKHLNGFETLMTTPKKFHATAPRAFVNCRVAVNFIPIPPRIPQAAYEPTPRNHGAYDEKFLNENFKRLVMLWAILIVAQKAEFLNLNMGTTSSEMFSEKFLE